MKPLGLIMSIKGIPILMTIGLKMSGIHIKNKMIRSFDLIKLRKEFLIDEFKLLTCFLRQSMSKTR